MMQLTTEEAPPTGRPAAAEFERAMDAHRRGMTAYCYRMLGSWDDAEDAVQDTYLRAWRALDAFEGRAQLRSWLYAIATNVCMTMLDGRSRRALPMDLEAPSSSTATLGAGVPEGAWIQPMLDRRVIDGDADPADVATSRDSIRLAFIAALQHLPPRQRAVLILRDVLRWRATEVADLLDVTVVSANGLLHRARATLMARNETGSRPASTPVDERQRQLLARYVDAFERLDIDTLVTLLHGDAVLSMPPYTLWLQGPRSITEWLVANACGGSMRLPLEVNGSPGFAVYKPSGPHGNYDAFAIEVVELLGDHITAIHAFIDPSLFTRFEVPATLAVSRV
jgi:RNA polymerase sigma-70 factor (ECF subfamily)